MAASSFAKLPDDVFVSAAMADGCSWLILSVCLWNHTY